MQPRRNTSSESFRAQPVGLLSKLRAAASDLRQGPKYVCPPRSIAGAGLGDNVGARSDGSGKAPSAWSRAEFPRGLASAALCLGGGAMLLYVGNAGFALPLFLAASILAGMSMLRLLPDLRHPAANGPTDRRRRPDAKHLSSTAGPSP